MKNTWQCTRNSSHIHRLSQVSNRSLLVLLSYTCLHIILLLFLNTKDTEFKQWPPTISWNSVRTSTFGNSPNTRWICIVPIVYDGVEVQECQGGVTVYVYCTWSLTGNRTQFVFGVPDMLEFAWFFNKPLRPPVKWCRCVFTKHDPTSR